MVEKLSQVCNLTNELQNCGYHPFQIKAIIRDTIDHSIDNATQQELAVLISTLENYIKFAQKCKACR
ncbi:MAG: hypothetical protein AB9895_03270 [Negativicutes bacterium]